MNAKLGQALVLLIVLAARTAADDPAAPTAKDADPFVGTYVSVATRADAPHRRLTITKAGDHYRLDDITPDQKVKSYYPRYTFIKSKKGQLKDERGVLGTLTLGHLAFADGSAYAAPILRLSFCYEQFYLVKEDGPAPAR